MNLWKNLINKQYMLKLLGTCQQNDKSDIYNFIAGNDWIIKKLIKISQEGLKEQRKTFDDKKKQ